VHVKSNYFCTHGIFLLRLHCCVLVKLLCFICLWANCVMNVCCRNTLTCITIEVTYEWMSLNNRNFILKCMENYAQQKILFRDTKWLLSNMSYRGCDDRAVWACAVGRTTWPLHCQLALWKSNEALFIFCGQRVWNLLKSTEEWRFNMAPSDFQLFVPMKEHLRGQKFADDDRVMEAVQSWLKAMPKSFFLVGICKLVDRWTTCVAKQGDYVEK